MSHSHENNCATGSQQSCCCSGDNHSHGPSATGWKKYLPAIVSFALLATGLALDVLWPDGMFRGYLRLGWYVAAYLPVGYPVIKEAIESIGHKDLFNEFTLMVVATLGAFFIGEYPEGVAVMLFYSVGELFQESAVSKARGNIKALLDVRPATATVLRQGRQLTVAPETVAVGETIQVKAGEKVPLDGTLLSPAGSFNTSALTGESVPRTIRQDQSVLAGMLNLDKLIELRVSKKYEDSSLAKILEMVQNATSRKAKTELLIRRFARVYTPAVFALALAIAVVPAWVVNEYVFSDWLYRALVFLVISCPCALVISVPLSYFGGIGAASRSGILFKGANYLDLITKVNTVVMDKTGTLTRGVFKVQQVSSILPANEQQMVEYAALLESHSNHPIAKAIVEYCPEAATRHYTIQNVEELAGYGLKGEIDGHHVMLGNSKLATRYGLEYNRELDTIVETTVLVFIDKTFAGHFTIADELKEDASAAIHSLRRLGIRQTVMLSGDKSAITLATARTLSIDKAYGDLLPEEKVAHIERLKADPNNVIAFVGDGINDAPVLALSDIGIAMGGMGADAAIEVADVVIQTDQPSKIATAIRIGKQTRRIVMQNITLAIGVKLLILIMGAMGVATMWEAVFADVGVSLLAILNAVRGLRKGKAE